MLHYMGPNLGPAPVAAMLPPATPGTIPSGVPGVQPNPGPLPPQPAIHAKAPVHPAHAALAAIIKHAASGAGGPPMPPPPPKYSTTTQEDGSILLHMQNPDGSNGPVVKVIPPIKRQNRPTP